MDSIKDLLQNRQVKKTNTNKIFLLSAEIAEITNSDPKRWLRACKKDYNKMTTVLSDFKDILRRQSVRHRLSYFLWLTKH